MARFPAPARACPTRPPPSRPTATRACSPAATTTPTPASITTAFAGIAPAIGRFVSRDPLGAWGDPSALGNAYTYSANSPWTYSDPLGLEVPWYIPDIFDNSLWRAANIANMDLKPKGGFVTAQAISGEANVLSTTANAYTDAATKTAAQGAVEVARLNPEVNAGITAVEAASKAINGNYSDAAKDAGLLMLPGAMKVVGGDARAALRAGTKCDDKLAKGAAESEAGAKQLHHFATNKNNDFTSPMEKIAGKYGLKLDEEWNKEMIEQLGRHPSEYHDFVLNEMQRASKEAGTDKQKFLELFEKYVKQPVRANPDLLKKKGWQ